MDWIGESWIDEKERIEEPRLPLKRRLGVDARDDEE